MRDGTILWLVESILHGTESILAAYMDMAFIPVELCWIAEFVIPQVDVTWVLAANVAMEYTLEHNVHIFDALSSVSCWLRKSNQLRYFHLTAELRQTLAKACN